MVRCGTGEPVVGGWGSMVRGGERKAGAERNLLRMYGAQEAGVGGACCH